LISAFTKYIEQKGGANRPSPVADDANADDANVAGEIGCDMKVRVS